MMLPAGAKLGPYEILSPLGEGGMGVVYRAMDHRLKRVVAIKILRDIDQDPDRLRRFTNEARAASALNHPHILTVYDIGESDGAPFIAMEFVDGTTLRQHIRAGALPIVESLDIAVQIALALHAAHEKGIVHRDLKPDNVMIRRDGYVKVVDFGLASLRANMPAGRAMLSASAFETTTGGGGTPAYMAPEQIDRGVADHRSDMFSFGVLLCELTTGSNPFVRPSMLETVAAIARTPEPAVASTSQLPASIAGIVHRLLAKRPEDRYSDMGEVVAHLREARRTLDAGSVAPLGLRRWQAAIAAAAVVGIGALVVALWTKARPTTPLALPMQITHFSTAVRDPTVSPDGRWLAYLVQEPHTTDTQVFVQTLPSGQPQQITHTPGRKAYTAFSRDGSRIAYTITGDEWKWDTWVTPVIGGTPQLLFRNASSLQWLQDGRVLFSEYKRGIQLAVVVADEGRRNQRDVYVPPPDGMAHISDVSPDGRLVVIGQMRTLGSTAGQAPLSCAVLPMDGGGPSRPVGDNRAPCSMFVRWSPDSRWLYFASGAGSQFQVFRQPASGGSVERITSGTGLAVMGVVTSFALTPDGRSMIYPSGEAQESLWVRRADGGETQLTFEGNARNPVPTRDGSRVFYIASARFAAGPIWMRAIDGSKPEHVCPGLLAMSVVPSPDERLVVFSSPDANQKLRIWACSIDNAAAPRPLTAGDGAESLPQVGPDGTIFYMQHRIDGVRIWRMNADGSGQQPVSESDPALILRSVSPDGRWLSVTRTSRTPREAWLYPSDGSGAPRFVCKTWEFAWGHRSFVLFNSGMISLAWMLQNPADAVLPPDLGDEPNEDRLAQLGGRRVLRADFFIEPRALPEPFAVVYSKVENHSNLYRVALPE